MNESKLFRFLRENWSFLAFIVFAIVAWTNLTNASETASKRLDAVESKVSEQNIVQQDISIQLSKIQTDILWIRERLSGIK